MVDILLYAEDQETLLKLERSVNEARVRAKVTSEIEVCASWVKMRTFSLVVLDVSQGISRLKQCIADVWDQNPECRVIVFGSDASIAVEALLHGAEVATEEELEATVLEAVQSLQQIGTGNLALEHILVVEDLDSPRDILCMFLEGLGYERITGVASGEEALQHLKASPNVYTTVLTDIRMPRMSGDELIRHIRKTEGLDRVPVVVLTAYGTPDCLIDCLRAGATGFLVKPPKKPDLKRELDRAHRVRRSGAPVRLIAEERVDQIYALLEERGLV